MATKGKTNNPAGRPKGVPNKITGILRETITLFIEDNFEEVVKTWKELEPVYKLRFYRDLLQFVLPKMQGVAMQTDFERLTDEQLDRIIKGLKNSYYEQTTKN